MAAIPPRPASFTPDGLPPRTVSMRVPFWQNRAVQTPRLQLVHTNGASGVATNQSSYNWATNKPEVNTLPHYQVQLDGQAAKYIPTDRRGLDNATVTSSSADWLKLTSAQRADITAHGQVRNWSIGIETSDLGYGAGKPGDLSGFTEAQIETLAGILAYDSIVWNIPLAYPDTWHAAGTACHTEPFEYPYWTLFRGKSCPGSRKKGLMRSRVLPRAAEIRAAWTGVTAPPPTDPITNPNPGDDDMKFRAYYLLEPGPGIFAAYQSPGCVGVKVQMRNLESWVAHCQRLMDDGVQGLDVAEFGLVHTHDPIGFAALGPILGDTPAGLDTFGVPL